MDDISDLDKVNARIRKATEAQVVAQIRAQQQFIDALKLSVGVPPVLRDSFCPDGASLVSTISAAPIPRTRNIRAATRNNLSLYVVFPCNLSRNVDNANHASNAASGMQAALKR